MFSTTFVVCHACMACTAHGYFLAYHAPHSNNHFYVSHHVGCVGAICFFTFRGMAWHGMAGRVLTEDELRRVGEFCERHGMTIVSDEIHADLILDEGLRHISMLALDNGVRIIAVYILSTLLSIIVRVTTLIIAVLVVTTM